MTFPSTPIDNTMAVLENESCVFSKGMDLLKFSLFDAPFVMLMEVYFCGGVFGKLLMLFYLLE